MIGTLWAGLGIMGLCGAARGQTFNDLAAGDWSTGGSAVWDQAGTPASGNPVVIDSHAITAGNASHTYQAQSVGIVSPGSLTASRPLGSVGSISNSGALSLQSGAGTLSLSGKEKNDTGDWSIGTNVTLQLIDTTTNVSHTGNFSGNGNMELKTGSGFVKTIGAADKVYNIGGTSTVPLEGNPGTLTFGGICTFGNLTIQRYSRGTINLPAGTHSVTGTLSLGHTGISGAGAGSTTLNVGNLVMPDCWMSVASYFQNMTMNVSGAGSYSSYLDRDNYFNCPVNLKSGAVFDHKWEFGGYGTGIIRGSGVWTIESGATFLKSTGVVVNGNGTTQVVGANDSRLLNPVTNLGTVRVQFGTLSLEGGFTQSAGTTELKGGKLKLSGTGSITGGSLSFEIGSTPKGISAGTLSLANCALQASLAGGFVPAATDVFTNITATTLSGGFSNVSSGSRLTLADGSWFVVTVTTGSNGKVVLSNYGRPNGTLISVQ